MYRLKQKSLNPGQPRKEFGLFRALLTCWESVVTAVVKSLSQPLNFRHTYANLLTITQHIFRVILSPVNACYLL